MFNQASLSDKKRHRFSGEPRHKWLLSFFPEIWSHDTSFLFDDISKAADDNKDTENYREGLMTMFSDAIRVCNKPGQPF
jgi:hypothetical protein